MSLTTRPAAAGRRWKEPFLAIVLPLTTGLLIVATLEAVHRSGIISPIVWPSPFSGVKAIFGQASEAEMWKELWVTVQEAMVGFVIGAVIAFTFGVLISSITVVRRGLYPFFIVFYSMPTVAFAPVFAAILGFGLTTKVVMAAAISFFPTLVNTIVGMNAADEDEIMLMRSLQASRVQVFRRLLLPRAMASIFGGLKTTITLAFVGAIVGELTAANAGIGRLVSVAALQYQIADVFAYVFWLAVISTALFRVLDFIDRKVIYWE